MHKIQTEKGEKAMKALRVFFVIAILAGFMAGICYAQEYMIPIKKMGEKANEKKAPDAGVCPKTKMDSSCLTCHTAPSFKLKESPIDEGIEMPAFGMKLNKDSVYYLIKDIESDPINKIFRWVQEHPAIKKITLEIHSPGGSLFDAYRIVSMIQAMQEDGYIIETKCYGFAASAGFYIFAAGNKGHRLASPNAEFMWHELLTFAMFSVSTPSSTEEQSRVLRHLQDTANGWLASVSNLTKEEIDALIHKKEFWLRGSEMIKYGFADGTP
uniref:Putative protease n=1 Tax=viral metagenome TaxID=1070528 RepID=A0A6M3KXE9_9ZZZZ